MAHCLLLCQISGGSEDHDDRVVLELHGPVVESALAMAHAKEDYGAFPSESGLVMDAGEGAAVPKRMVVVR